MAEQEKSLTYQEWQDLREQLFVLLDITWDHSVNVATLEQLSVKRLRDEGGQDYAVRVKQVYDRRFKEIKGDSFERVIAVINYLKKLGMPQELWPKKIGISGISGEK